MDKYVNFSENISFYELLKLTCISVLNFKALGRVIVTSFLSLFTFYRSAELTAQFSLRRRRYLLSCLISLPNVLHK